MVQIWRLKNFTITLQCFLFYLITNWVTLNSAADCSRTHTIQNGETCWKIWTDNQLTEQQFRDVNPGINCDKLTIGQKVCLPSTTTGAPKQKTQPQPQTPPAPTKKSGSTTAKIVTSTTPRRVSGLTAAKIVTTTTPLGVQGSSNVTCVKHHSVSDGETCWVIWTQQGLLENSFMAMNPNVNCNNLQIGQQVCIDDGTIRKNKCVENYRVVEGDTCYSITQQYGINDTYFYGINPSINCESLQIGQVVCIGNGTFNLANCVRTIRVGENATCPSLANLAGLNESDFMKINPDIDCGHLLMDQIVCVTGLGGLDKSAALQLTVQKLSTLPNQLKNEYSNYIKDPSAANEAKFRDQLQNSLTSAEGAALLTEAAKADPKFQKMQDSLGASRKEECEQLKKSQLSSNVKNCMCSELQPYLYCKALMNQEIENVLKSSSGEINRLMDDIHKDMSTISQEKQRRQKRAGCDWDAMARFKGCMAGGCSVPIVEPPLLELKVSAEWCIPYMNWLAKGPEICFTTGCKGLEWDENNWKQMKNAVDGATVSGNFKMCLLIEQVRQVLAKLGIGLCYDIVSIEFNYMKMQLKIKFGPDIFIVKFSFGGAIQVARPHDQVCSIEKLKCEEYCVMKPGQGYFFIDITFHILIFSKTVNVYKSKKFTCENTDTQQKDWQNRIVGYWESWRHYSKGQAKMKSDALQKMTHMNYGFATISFNQDSDTWYLDIADAWADVGMCYGTSDPKQAPCETDTSSCIKLPSSSLTCTFNGRITMQLAPYIGANTGGQCPQNCYNKGGPPVPRNPLCHTNMSGYLRPLQSSGDVQSYACGQYAYLLKEMASASGKTKYLISIGGWYDGNYFSVATSAKYRQKLINSITHFLDVFPFDGVDIDWEYPGFEHGGQPMPGGSSVGNADTVNNCVKSRCSYDRSNDAEQMISFLTELSGELKKKKTPKGDSYLLTVAAPAGYDKIEKFGNRLKDYCNAVDFLNVMTYDFHGAWDDITNFQSAIKASTPGVTEREYSISDAIKMYTSAGCNSNKLVLGVPFYGRVYNQVQKGNNAEFPGLYQPYTGKPATDLTRIREYRDIVSNPAFKTYWSESNKASYAFDEGSATFINYDSKQAVEAKMRFLKENGLGGAMIWTPIMDDDANTLLNTIAGQLKKN